MPALPVIAHVYRCALEWTSSDGQNAVNVIHIRDNTPPHTEADVMSTLDATVAVGMWSPVSSSAVVTTVAITALDGVSATNDFAPATPAHWTGSNGADFSPPTAAIVKMKTAHRGRSHRGRIFLPFIAEDVSTKGVLTGSVAAATTTAWNTFQAALEAHGGGWQVDVASYKLATSEIVTNFICESMLAVQRRRQERLRAA